MNKLNSEYMNSFVKSSFLAIGCLLYSLSAFSQDGDKDNKDKPFNESFDFVQTYKPKISDALKLNITPVIEKIEFKKDTISYKTDPKLLQIDLKSTAKIGTVSLIKNKSKDSRDELQRLFIKAGIGNYSNIFAQLDYNTTKMENSMLAVHFQHHSGNADITGINSDFGEQNLYLAGRKYFKNTLLASKIYLDNNKLHLYGFPVNDTLKSNVTQNYFNYGLNAELNNEIDTNAKLKYWVDFKYDNFSNAFKASESEVDIKGTIEQKIKNYPIRFSLGYLNKSYQLDKVVEPNYIIHVGANYLITKENWRTEVGFFIDYDSDTAQEQNTHIYPNIYSQINLYNNSLIMFAGITGNLISNSFKSITEENPYIRDTVEFRNTNNKFEIYGGFKGNFSKDFNYMVKLSYQNLESMLMFVNDTLELNRFEVIYEKDPIFLLKLHAELNKFINDKLEIFLGFNYYDYTMATEDYPWHKPVYDIKLSAKYKLEKKIFVSFDLLALGERKAKNLHNLKDPYILDPIYDANVGVTYQFNKMIGVFFQFNNILSTKYSYWNNYELRGFQVVGGLKVNF